jgi:hypothetical protein
MKGKLIQVDFYPNGKIVRIYEGDVVVAVQSDTRHMTPKEALQIRVEEYKRKKAGK